MPKLSVLLITLSIHVAAAAQSNQEMSGIDQNGNCVKPCKGVLGPCDPCMRISQDQPGSADWDMALQEWRRNNEAFGRAVRNQAKIDNVYRKSPDFKADTKVFKDTNAAVDRLGKLGATMKLAAQ